jgi:hypothetical protein
LKQYNGDQSGTLRWISTDEVPAVVTIHGKMPSAGHVIARVGLPHWRTRITITEGVKIVQEPTNCNEWKLVFENPKALPTVDITWKVY